MTRGGDAAPTRVLIVDDQRAFLESLRTVVDLQADLTCVGTAVTAEDAVRLAASERPDVVLMDVELPGEDGIEATERILADAPTARVVVLTGRPDATVLARAAGAGASAFLLKDASLEDILDAVRQPPSRRLEIHADALDRILHEHALPPGANELTQRELEVLALLAQGLQPKQIAQRLAISVPTCRGYVKSLLQKLGVHSALEAVVTAHRTGVIRLPG